jgi:CHAD domain-containing protein
MIKLSPELLDRSPEEIARLLALSLLDQAATAQSRLDDSEDLEALHDFRVSLRRLRSLIRAYRPYLKGSVPKKTRGRLKNLTSSTNKPRDTEVQIAWLKDQTDNLTTRQQVGLAWMVERLETSVGEDRAHPLSTVPQDFRKVQKLLTKKLSSWTARVNLGQTGRSPSFGNVTGSLIRDHVTALSSHLNEIHSPEDNEAAHVARISAKRLRYLLEPLSHPVDGVKPLVHSFKTLQDLLGDLHDTNLLAAEIGTALEVSAVERARRLHQETFRPPAGDARGASKGTQPEEHAGLMALARLLRDRRRRLFGRLEADWLAGHSDQFLHEVALLGDRLGSGKKSHPSPIEKEKTPGTPLHREVGNVPRADSSE